MNQSIHSSGISITQSSGEHIIHDIMSSSPADAYEDKTASHHDNMDDVLEDISPEQTWPSQSSRVSSIAPSSLSSSSSSFSSSSSSVDHPGESTMVDSPLRRRRIYPPFHQHRGKVNSDSASHKKRKRTMTGKQSVIADQRHVNTKDDGGGKEDNGDDDDDDSFLSSDDDAVKAHSTTRSTSAAPAVSKEFDLKSKKHQVNAINLIQSTDDHSYRTDDGQQKGSHLNVSDSVSTSITTSKVSIDGEKKYLADSDVIDLTNRDDGSGDHGDDDDEVQSQSQSHSHTLLVPPFRSWSKQIASRQESGAATTADKMEIVKSHEHQHEHEHKHNHQHQHGQQCKVAKHSSSSSSSSSPSRRDSSILPLIGDIPLAQRRAMIYSALNDIDIDRHSTSAGASVIPRTLLDDRINIAPKASSLIELLHYRVAYGLMPAKELSVSWRSMTIEQHSNIMNRPMELPSVIRTVVEHQQQPELEEEPNQEQIQKEKEKNKQKKEKEYEEYEEDENYVMQTEMTNINDDGGDGHDDEHHDDDGDDDAHTSASDAEADPPAIFVFDSYDDAMTINPKGRKVDDINHEYGNISDDPDWCSADDDDSTGDESSDDDDEEDESDDDDDASEY